MSQDHLGLYDTPPTREEARLAVLIVAGLLAISLVILPFSDRQWAAVPTFLPVAEAMMLVGELIIATVLYSQAVIFRSRSLVVLASGYVFIALLLIPHALTFPGGFAPDGLLGAGLSTSAWLAMFRRLGFPAAVILYVLSERASTRDRPETERPAANLWIGLLAAFVLASAATVFALGWADTLPALFTSKSSVAYRNVFAINAFTIGFSLIAILLIFLRRKSVLDMWLLVALAVWLIQTLVNLPTHHRFTVGWYALLVMMLISNFIVLLALIAESSRLYARLAVATAARNRERQAERMSIDAVAAAISHEVGQPLTALSLNASAGMNALTSARPNVPRAIESLREIGDSAKRTFDVLRSIRSMIAKEPGWANELNLNELVREAVSSLDREMAAARVSLELSLDQDLPEIVANRVQLRHVVINLLVNALGSVSATRGRRRQIAVRSSAEGNQVLLNITDNGIGLAEEDSWRVFDAVQGGNSDTSGIRLSLCRTIIEEHGGRIKASSGEIHGQTFAVALPGRR